MSKLKEKERGLVLRLLRRRVKKNLILYHTEREDGGEGGPCERGVAEERKKKRALLPARSQGNRRKERPSSSRKEEALSERGRKTRASKGGKGASF